MLKSMLIIGFLGIKNGPNAEQWARRAKKGLLGVKNGPFWPKNAPLPLGAGACPTLRTVPGQSEA